MTKALKKHLLAGIISSMACLVLTAWVMSAPEFPGPRLSDNVSFNEKAKWLRINLADRNCDVLVLGSSMSVNNFNADSFRKLWPNKIINSGYWNASSEEDLAMLRVILDICTPKVIILPLFYDDLRANHGDIDWHIFARYVGDNSVLTVISTYVSGFGLNYYWRRMLDKVRPSYQQRREYTSLYLDWSGGVGFACNNFEIMEQRWEGYRTVGRLSQPVPEAIESLSEIARVAKQLGAVFIVAVVPMRRAAEEALDPPAVNALWDAVAAATVSHGGHFTRRRGGELDDTLFADFAHLNACGAERWTSAVLSEFETLISSRLSTGFPARP